jgi:hypothetical protein
MDVRRRNSEIARTAIRRRTAVIQKISRAAGLIHVKEFRSMRGPPRPADYTELH